LVAGGVSDFVGGVSDFLLVSLCPVVEGADISVLGAVAVEDERSRVMPYITPPTTRMATIIRATIVPVPNPSVAGRPKFGFS